MSGQGQQPEIVLRFAADVENLRSMLCEEIDLICSETGASFSLGDGFDEAVARVAKKFDDYLNRTAGDRLEDRAIAAVGRLYHLLSEEHDLLVQFQNPRRAGGDNTRRLLAWPRGLVGHNFCTTYLSVVMMTVFGLVPPREEADEFDSLIEVAVREFEKGDTRMSFEAIQARLFCNEWPGTASKLRAQLERKRR
jgi:hypothetical protein